MSKQTVITISRQYGSGGRLIGQRLAEILSIPFYDNHLISLAAQKAGYNEDILKSADERPASSFLYSSLMGNYALGAQYPGGVSMPLNDHLFLLQSGLIKDAAREGSCVIIGRCANYVLKDLPHLFSVFVHAPITDRIERAINEYKLPQEKIRETIEKIDKRRAAYYNYYTDSRWGKQESYHLSINSSLLGVEKTAEVLAHIVSLTA